jgi:hypothetical protein
MRPLARQVADSCIVEPQIRAATGVLPHSDPNSRPLSPKFLTAISFGISAVLLGIFVADVSLAVRIFLFRRATLWPSSRFIE